jgi:hypothetical protein
MLRSENAFINIHTMLNHCTILLGFSQLETLGAIRSHLHYFSSLKPNVVLRSIALLLFRQDTICFTRFSFHHLLIEDIIQFCPTASLIFSLIPVDPFAHSSANSNSAITSASRSSPRNIPSILVNQQQSLSLFLVRLAQVLKTYYRALLTTRARHQHHLESNLLDWANIQHDSHTLDLMLLSFFQMCNLDIPEDVESVGTPAGRSKPYTFSFYSYVTELSIAVYIHYLTIGLECQLYTLRELSVVYWYLEYFYDIRLQNRRLAYRDPAIMSYLKPFAIASLKDADKRARQTNSSSNSKSKHKEKKVQKSQKHTIPKFQHFQTVPPQTSEVLLMEIHMTACRGICQMLRAISRLGSNKNPDVVPNVHPEFFANYFAHRFSALTVLSQPTPPTAEAFRNQMNIFDTLAPEAVIELADSSFKVVKDACTRLLNSVPNILTALPLFPNDALKQCPKSFHPFPIDSSDLRALLRVTVTNAIGLLGWQKIFATSSPDQVPAAIASFDLHPIFPILQQRKPRNK